VDWREQQHQALALEAAFIPYVQDNVIGKALRPHKKARYEKQDWKNSVTTSKGEALEQTWYWPAMSRQQVPPPLCARFG
jgi:hypothetical protein